MVSTPVIPLNVASIVPVFWTTSSYTTFEPGEFKLTLNEAAVPLTFGSAFST